LNKECNEVVFVKIVLAFALASISQKLQILRKFRIKSLAVLLFLVFYQKWFHKQN